LKEQFIGKIWVVGGAEVLTVPKKLVKIFNLKKGKHYRITLEEVSS
jgi:hypothetical protein